MPATAFTSERGFTYSLSTQNPLGAPLRDELAIGALPSVVDRDAIRAALAPSSLNDPAFGRAVDFLNSPYSSLSIPDPGSRIPRAKTGVKESHVNSRVAPTVPSDVRVDAAVDKPAVVSRAQAATGSAECSAQDAFEFDDDDDFMANFDVDEVVKQKRAISPLAKSSTIAPEITSTMTRRTEPVPQPVSVPPQVQPTASVQPTQVRMPPVGVCQAPPLDGSGADWLCEHGVSLRDCQHRVSHVEKLKPELDKIIFQLEDDDVVLKNSDRKLLMRQRVEAETIVRVCTSNRTSMPPTMTMTNASMDTHMLHQPQRPMELPQYQAPSTSFHAPENNWSMCPTTENFDNGNFPGWNDDLEVGDDVVIPMNGIGSVNTGNNIKAVDCQINCGDAKDWGHTNFQWSKLCEATLRNTFNAKSFRSLQLLAVNATMAARDCLVLMPTGGGKSLCYQLPAVVKPGITVVISPLISLIQDQLYHLSEIGISATCLSAAKESDNEVYADLSKATPHLRLLYVTPEKVVRSGKLKSALQRLYSRGVLNRFVLDEAHCISAWGHDFRKDYTELRGLKHLFPTTPIMCLTATATRRVQDDIVRQLNLPKCLRFFDTFNRTNLTYEVHPKLKGKAMVSQIKDLIVQRGLVRNARVQSGIIYCFSQNDCERLATELSKIEGDDRRRFPRRLRAAPYHAGLPEATRKKHQEMWQRGEVQVICATVAFGMGINKPNVRFVFHHSMPKSLEAYHQESGRAGRDGEHGLCILFYSWGDASKARSMLIDSAKKERAQPAVLQNNLESLNTMVSYCENLADCRRTQLMAHFDERFDRQRCRGMCDSCAAIAAGAKFEPTDVSNYAIGILKIVKSTPEGIGIGLLVDVFRGSNAKAVTQKQYNRLPGYGSGKGLDKSDSERLARALVLRGYLSENTIRSEGGLFATTVTTIHYNRQRCEAMERGREVFNLYIKQRTTGRKAALDTTTVVVMDPIGTQPGTQTNVNQFLEESLAPEAVQARAREEEIGLAVFNALITWRTRMVKARELKEGKEVNADVAFPPNLFELLKVAKPCTQDSMKVFIDNSVNKASERTAIIKHQSEVVNVVAQAVDCAQRGVANPYIEEDGRNEDEIEDDEEIDPADDNERRRSVRLSQQPIQDYDPSPAWKKARRSQE